MQCLLSGGKTIVFLSFKNDHRLWRDRESELHEVIILNYFWQLYSSKGCHSDVWLDVIVPVVETVDNDFLLAPLLEMEIKEALFSMKPNKSPGPNGMNLTFFSKILACCGKEVCLSCFSIISNRSIPTDLSNTHIVLIPKKKSVECMGDLRPIFLCNVIYKIVAKAMANRLRKFLPKIVSHNQGSFIVGRDITDNILVSYEVLNYLKRKTQGKLGYAALKVDMSKAYDRMEWTFFGENNVNDGFHKH